MIAQYYKKDKIINIFKETNSTVWFDIPSKERKLWGFPPFSQWKRVSWGCELKFHFEIVTKTG